MTRAQGFARGDLDTSFPLDDKFLALRGSVDPPTYYAAAGVYFHIVAATWREAERKPGSRVAPDAPELIAHLVRVGLLDGDECVQRRAYTHLIGRALRARRTATNRKQRNRAGMSRETDRDSDGRHGMSTDIQSGAERSGAVQSGADQSGAVQSGERADKPRPRTELQVVATAIHDRGLLPASGYVLTDLRGLVKGYGALAVIEAFGHCPEARTTKALVKGAERHLEPIAGRNGATPSLKGHTRPAQEVIDAFRG